jgi:uncharacterized protein (DUF2141 family)
LGTHCEHWNAFAIIRLQELFLEEHFSATACAPDQAAAVGGIMRSCLLALSIAVLALLPATAQQATPATTQGFTLTVIVEGVDERDGNVGLLVFNSPKGWAEDRQAALKDITVPAHQGTVTVTIPGLPAGEYGVSVVHDVNKNHKLDRNFLGKPTEQWGLSNNPHATLKTPSYDACKFTLKGDMELHIKMQM